MRSFESLNPVLVKLCWMHSEFSRENIFDLIRVPESRIGLNRRAQDFLVGRCVGAGLDYGFDLKK